MGIAYLIQVDPLSTIDTDASIHIYNNLHALAGSRLLRKYRICLKVENRSSVAT